MPERIVVIGGNAAGMTVASRAKRLAPDLEITILEQGAFISYSICGVPFMLGWNDVDPSRLITFTPERLLSERSIAARTGVRVDEIQPGRRRLQAGNLATGESFHVDYDRLVIATGYLPRVLSQNQQCDNLFTISRLEDGLRLRRYLENHPVRRAAVVGAGYVGLMMTQALTQQGISVELWDRQRQVFPALDEEMSERLGDFLQARGVVLRLGHPVELAISGSQVTEVASGRERQPVDVVLMDVGVRPNTQLAERAGIACGMSGAIEVDECGKTSMNGIYAAGNCAETRHLITGRPVFATTGTVAAQQGRVVGETLAGRRSRYRGTLETSIEQVFELGVARTGLTLRQALTHGFKADAVEISGRTRAAYHPESAGTRVRLVFQQPSGKLLGGQILGEESSAKRIDTLVVALTRGMTVADLAQLDLAYSPSYSTLWDPIQVAANVALRRLG